MTLKKMPHDTVVPMGVDADVARLLEAIVKHRSEDPVSLWQAGNAMDDDIGLFVIKPLTVVNPRIGRLGTGQAGKGGHGPLTIEHQVAATSVDIPLESLCRRIAVGPLMKVPTLAHDVPGGGSELQHDRDIGRHGRANAIRCLAHHQWLPEEN